MLSLDNSIGIHISQGNNWNGNCQNHSYEDLRKLQVSTILIDIFVKIVVCINDYNCSFITADGAHHLGF